MEKRGSFHVTYMDPDGGPTRTCCDCPGNLREWMLRCLGAKPRTRASSVGAPDRKVSGHGVERSAKVSLETSRKARRAADGGRAASADLSSAGGGASRSANAVVHEGGRGRGGRVNGRAEEIEALGQKKAVRKVHESRAFARDVARALEVGKTPEVVEVGPNSLHAALKSQYLLRGIKFASEDVKKILHDAGTLREATSAWLCDSDNRKIAFAAPLKAQHASASKVRRDPGAQSVQAQAGGKDALRDMYFHLLESETHLGQEMHMFAIAQLLGTSIAVLQCRGKVGGKPWVIWNAKAGLATDRLYLSRHGDDFGSLKDLEDPGVAEAPSDEEVGGGWMEEEMGAGGGGEKMEEGAGARGGRDEKMEEAGGEAARPIPQNKSSVGELTPALALRR